jgi:hypothetical protein
MDELQEVIEKKVIEKWLDTPNGAFMGRKPREVIAAGGMDKIREMIYRLTSGEPS